MIMKYMQGGACWGRTAIIFNLEWKAMNFQREEKTGKQDIKRTENESSGLSKTHLSLLSYAYS